MQTIDDAVLQGAQPIHTQGLKTKKIPRLFFLIDFDFNHYFIFKYWKIAELQACSAAQEKKEKCAQVFEIPRLFFLINFDFLAQYIFVRRK